MLTFENFVTFRLDEEPEIQLRSFWEAENGFVWSKGKWCEATFDFEINMKSSLGLAELILDLDVYRVPEHLPGQNVLIYLNGFRIGSNFVTRQMNSISSFDPKILRSTENILTLDTPDVASPQEYGSSDTRQLGVKLFSVQIRKAG